MNRALYFFCAFIGGHPRSVLAASAVGIAFGIWGAGNFQSAAQNGTSGLYGSPSYAVTQALRSEFNNPFLEPLIVAVSSPRFSIDDPAFLDWDRDAAQSLRSLGVVKQVAAYADFHDPHLRAPGGHQTVLLVGLNATDVVGQQRAVRIVRTAVVALRARLSALDPQAQVAVTGVPAADYDVNTSSATGGDHAEKRALPLTLGILILVFGTLIAAALPFLMGLATTRVSLGLAFVLAQAMPVTNLLGNVVTMIGLAVGIDYSLLMVQGRGIWRVRQCGLAGAENDRSRIVRRGAGRRQRDSGIRGPCLHEHCGALELVSGTPAGTFGKTPLGPPGGGDTPRSPVIGDNPLGGCAIRRGPPSPI